MKKLQACPGYVIVKRDAAVTKTESGIIPEGQGKKPCRGVVTSVGRFTLSTREIIPKHVAEQMVATSKESVGAEYSVLSGHTGTLPVTKVGDSVLFSLYAGAEVEVGVDTFVVLKAEDILCRVVEE